MSNGDLPIIVLCLVFSPAYIILGKILFSQIKQHIENHKKEKEKKLLERVAKYSEKIKALKEASQNNHVFCDIADPSIIEYQCKTKKALDNANVKDTLIYLANNNEELKELDRKIAANREHGAAFWATINTTLNVQTSSIEIENSKLDKQKFFQLEEKLCQNYLESFRLDTNIIINMVYYTPKRKYRYIRSFNTNYQGIQKAKTDIIIRKAKKTEASMERAKMSDKLRYEILTRDHHRCVICGRGADDGVKLHIDHIKPVSKGGKTEPSNLRVLCDSCNLGKGDMYNQNGLN